LPEVYHETLENSRVNQKEEKDQNESITKRGHLHNQLGLMRSKQKKFGLAIAQFYENLKLDGKQQRQLALIRGTLARPK
jgi:hypothetical protein